MRKITSTPQAKETIVVMDQAEQAVLATYTLARLTWD